ncbi:FHA domain-containing protein [bacterium]|nr:FHA domain-containing protein [bacterium]
MYELSIFFRETLVGRSTFTKDELRIGRSADNDVQIDNLALSRHHAAIERAGGAFIFKDFGSTNGSFVNGDKIAGRRALTDGDRISLGKFTIIFRAEMETAVPAEVRDRAAYAIAGETARLRVPTELIQRAYPWVGFLEEPGTGTKAPTAHAITRDVFSIGSAEACDLVLEGIPPRVAAIVRASSGFVLLALSPHVRRNGAPVELDASLAADDEVAFGGNRCFFRLSKPEAGP